MICQQLASVVWCDACDWSIRLCVSSFRDWPRDRMSVFYWITSLRAGKVERRAVSTSRAQPGRTIGRNGQAGPERRFLDPRARWRRVAGAGCVACGQRGSPCSKAVRYSSPTRWVVAFSWRLATARASPGRSAPGPARSSTHGAQVRRPMLLVLDPREPLTRPQIWKPLDRTRGP